MQLSTQVLREYPTALKLLWMTVSIGPVINIHANLHHQLIASIAFLFPFSLHFETINSFPNRVLIVCYRLHKMHSCLLRFNLIHTSVLNDYVECFIRLIKQIHRKSSNRMKRQFALLILLVTSICNTPWRVILPVDCQLY